MLITPKSEKEINSLLNAFYERCLLIEKLLTTDPSFKKALTQNEIKARIESFLKSDNCQAAKSADKIGAIRDFMNRL